MIKRIFDVVRYISHSSNTFEYIGCLGIDNLGDEILYDAIKNYFPNTKFISPFHPLNKTCIKNWVNRQKRLGVIMGGGTLLRTQWEIENFKMQVERLGSGVIFGTGIGNPNFHSENNIVSLLQQHANFFNSLEFIGVRGPESKETLAKAGINSEIIGDLACSFTQALDFWRPTKKRKIGINIGHSNGLVWGSEEQIYAVYSELIKLLLIKGWEVELYVVWKEDLSISQKLALETGLKLENIIVCTNDLFRYLDRVRTVNVFIGIKLHSVILAMCANVPSVMIEYRPKCRDFMDSVEMLNFCFKSDMIEARTLYEKVEDMCIEGKKISSDIHDRFSYYSNLQTIKAGEILRSLEKKLIERGLNAKHSS
jgi:polysaccharide pyruvyl transferase WcaK-like protein